MYSQNELDEAVAAGAITAEAAASLRAYIERQDSSSTVDEEQFRLLKSRLLGLPVIPFLQ